MQFGSNSLNIHSFQLGTSMKGKMITVEEQRKKEEENDGKKKKRSWKKILLNVED